jgi:ABC-2 type transport system ATP-binding protein
MVELRNVSRWYGEVIGVNRVTATLRPGITGLLGPNGAGKSTLMNLIGGMIAPSEGEVLVHGEAPFANPNVMHRLGYCHQSDAFYEKMTGFDFVRSMLEVRGYGRARARTAAEHALAQLGMVPNMHRRIQGYSKGMRQRTKVALAIAHSPDIVILDEPLNGLDAVGRHEMIELIRHFGKEGRNVLISSHVLHEIEAMTNNILMMSGGYLLAEGDVRDVRKDLSRHPHRVLLRCADPRAAAMRFLALPSTVSAAIDGLDSTVMLMSRDLDAFHEALTHYILDDGGSVSLVTVADENLGSVFEYLGGGRIRGTP